MSLTTRRAVQTLLRRSHDQNRVQDLETVASHVWHFVHALQKRYPFNFATAHRDLPDEHHRWIQEQLVSYLLFGMIAELTRMEQPLADKAWVLGSHLGKMIGKGGEHFWPREFNPVEKSLAEEIGEKHFAQFVGRAEELSLAMNFKLGPVNSAEHVVAWSFRYVRQLIMAAKWESVIREKSSALHHFSAARANPCCATNAASHQ
jgi:hypothetical protein